MTTNSYSFLTEEYKSGKIKLPEYLQCQRHGYTFVKGGQCPKCLKRSIYDDWSPSAEQEQTVEQPASISMVAGMSGQKLPKLGTYKLVSCPLHNTLYVSGLNNCPMCD